MVAAVMQQLRFSKHTWRQDVYLQVLITTAAGDMTHKRWKNYAKTNLKLVILHLVLKL